LTIVAAEINTNQQQSNYSELFIEQHKRENQMLQPTLYHNAAAPIRTHAVVFSNTLASTHEVRVFTCTGQECHVTQGIYHNAGQAAARAKREVGLKGGVANG
jgi:hypothetical protein